MRGLLPEGRLDGLSPAEPDTGALTVGLILDRAPGAPGVPEKIEGDASAVVRGVPFIVRGLLLDLKLLLVKSLLRY